MLKDTIIVSLLMIISPCWSNDVIPIETPRDIPSGIRLEICLYLGDIASGGDEGSLVTVIFNGETNEGGGGIQDSIGIHGDNFSCYRCLGEHWSGG